MSTGVLAEGEGEGGELTVRDIESNGGYTCSRRERDRASQTRQTQNKAERARQPDCTLSLASRPTSGHFLLFLFFGGGGGGEQHNIPVRIGDLVFSSTLWKNLWPGMAPSRENAYIIRLLDVIENVPQKNIAPITIT